MSANMDINPETGEAIYNSSGSPRFTTWVAFFVFTTITLGASVEVKNDQIHPTGDARWAVACSAVTFTLTAITVGMHMWTTTAAMIVGTMIEGIMCVVLMAFWAVTVSIVSDADNNLAVGIVTNTGNDNSNGSTAQTNSVLNGNLYYFSWAGFVTSIVLMVSYLRSVFGVDVAGALQTRAARLPLWSGMLASSLIVMGSAVNVFEINCKPMIDPEIETVYCRRTKYAISLGTIGVFFSILIVGIKLVTAAAPFVVEGLLALLLSLMNAFGVAYITSAKGPGSAIGNLYYFSWISFLCSAMLAASCYNDASSIGQPQPDGEQQNKDNGGFPVENLPEEHVDTI